jgi:hypothetical protein
VDDCSTCPCTSSSAALDGVFSVDDQYTTCDMSVGNSS